MTGRAIARRYAAALFDVAAETQHVDAVQRDLSAFADLVRSSAPLRHVFDNPAVPAQNKHALIDALLSRSGEIAIEVRRLLLMLADRDRLGLIGEISNAFADRSLEAARVVSAEVVTAVPMSAERAAALADALSRVTGQQVTVNERVDPAIIGGVIAKVGSVLFDGSVRRQLERMREKLLAEA